jgi:hypothetical protein
MISILPKLADRNFIVGFFLPTLLAAVAMVVLLNDFPAIHRIFNALIIEKKWEESVAFTLAVWVFSVFLMVLNYHFYRIAEGYTVPLAWLGTKRTTCQRHKLFRERERLIKVEETAPSEKTRASAGSRIDDLDLQIANRFPHESVPTLPTLFGNAIRAFEVYPAVVYGVDAIPAWPRLAGVITKEYASTIADAKAEVDFFLNLFFLLLLIVAIAAGRILYDFYQCGCTLWSEAQVFFVLYAGVSATLAFMSYHGAIARVIAWGHLVKGAFDLYLPALATTLGYELPRTLNERKDFWNAFSLMCSYLKPMEPTPYLPIKPAAEMAPRGPKAHSTPQVATTAKPALCNAGDTSTNEEETGD